ncbi:MAG: T9SS type A sorting domain-containing protein [Ignavibacteriaceae bacterium]|jgi:hypothetical protein|nr:T9SS type A sorting domain-containing protein [Ignavibacteriaceae bacterium]
MLSSTKSRLAGKTFFFKLFLLIIVLAASGESIIAQYDWTRHPNNPLMSGSGPGTWDKHVMFPFVLFNADSSRYEMFYCGSYGPEVSWWPYRIGFAWSSDGINWTKYAGNPVLVPAPGTWDENSIDLGSVLRENGEYKLWYCNGFNAVDRQIGYATSPDGINWTKYTGNPVLSGGSEAWEAGGILWCSVVSNSGTYTMYYSGLDITSTYYSIGRATSPDGINWQKDTLNNPILTPDSGQWDSKAVCGPYCFYTSSTIYLYYTGWAMNYTGNTIGLATSTDNGLTWNKYASNPVLNSGPAGSWDGDYVEVGSVMLLQDTLIHLWYDGSRDNTATNLWRIGLATSTLVVSVEEEAGQPSEFTLEQNYPNPFNPKTTIRYSIPTQSKVVIKVFDVLGNEIATLMDEEKSVGSYELTWNPSNLPSGIYFYQLKAGNYVNTKKMILLK